jgi:hypothetical protein
MGKVTGFLEIDRRDRRYAPGPALVLLASCLFVASSTTTYACRVARLPPVDERLHAAPDDAALAAKGIIKRIVLDGPIEGIPHHGFRLELQIIQVFKGDSGPVIVVAYGPCDYLPGEVGETVNVLVRRGFNDELVAY